MELKEKLKALRTAANLTQEELAGRIFVSRTLVSKWESGDRYPSKDNLARLSLLFDISQDELIGKQKEKYAYNKYNIISILFSAFCCILTLILIVLFVLAVIENGDLTGMGGFMICIVYVLPVIISLVLFETITLKKKNGYKNLELYSLFSLILVWLISILGYLYLI